MAEEKDEGEISSSDQDEEDCPPAKQPKISDVAEPARDALSKNQKSQRRKKKKLKSEKRKQRKQQQLIQQCRSSPWNSSTSLSAATSSLATEFLGPDQTQTLELLVSLLGSPAPPDREGPRTLKTAKFQGVLLHLLLGVPWLQSPVERLEELRRLRVAVLWLSMVPAQLFLSSAELFRGLKALSPSVRFFVEHPGSTRFVKLGLEALLLLPEEEGQRQGGGGEGGRCEQISKADCLLSLSDMEKNNFPVPPSGSEGATDGQQWDKYFKLCQQWPSHAPDLGHTPGLGEASGYPMFAVDCEMVLTGDGLELARVSLVNEALVCIYDQLVKPEKPVLDYKTQFSGITQDTLEGVSTALPEVHAALRSLLPPQCILIGHSLENDLSALKMAHPYVVDTSCLFTSCKNSLSKPKLRLLTKRLLGSNIQMGSSGHSSVEDATACMRLVQLRMRDRQRATIPWKNRSILTEVAAHNHSVATVDRPGVVGMFGHGTTKHTVSSDQEVVDCAADIIAKHNLTFLQLHGYEDHLKQRSADNGAKMGAVIEDLDSRVMRLVAECPSKTLVFVVCGSSDIREVKRLQQTQDHERLKEAVGVARTGLVLAFTVD